MINDYNVNDDIINTEVIDRYNNAVSREDYELAEQLKHEYNSVLHNNNDYIFRVIWCDSNFDENFELESELTDDNYILFKRWSYDNWGKMCLRYFNDESYLKNDGMSDRICFQLRCKWCDSQRLYGIERCKGCVSFRGDYEDMDDLHIIEK